jgi:hypothetical protein
MNDEPDPTKAPDFLKVIRHFVTTPHKPHEPLGAKHKRDAADKASPKLKRGKPAAP